ncbi:hypothetical protein LBMAG56_35670 [Verrucomicrobiota bacterium]|nr:hypothetical protein LBMAG56_35670 [Verrucomicrobiota bacterium]
MNAAPSTAGRDALLRVRDSFRNHPLPLPRYSLPLAFLAALLLLLALALAPAASAATVSAALDTDTIRLGEAATISVTCNGGRPRSLPRLTAVPGLQFGYAGESSQFTIVNGQASQSFTYSFQVQPQKEGRFIIPPIQVDIGGQNVPTGPLTLTVLAANSRAPEANPLAKYAFLRLVVPKTNVFVGEVFPVEIKLFVQSAQNLQIPQVIGDGFRFTLLRPTSAQTREQHGNAIYNVVTFRTGAIASRTGIVPLAFETELTLILYQGAGGIFGERRPVKISSDSISLHVAPLPATNVPASFNGAVGSFNLTMQASPTTLAVGDPLTIRVQIAGRGELDALQLPPTTVWREFKTYPPTSKVEPADPLSMTGVKNFEIVALPENAEVKELAPLEFSFFDPEQRAYRTLYTSKFPLTVRPGTVSAQQPTIVSVATNRSADAPPPPPPPAQDIVHIKTRPGTLALARPPLVEQPLFLALQSVPLLAWLTLLIRRRHAESLANNPRRQRALQTDALIKSGLREARVLAEQNQTQKFFATVFRLLQEQIGERLDQPGTAITEEVIETRLRPLGASDELLKTLHELFRACNQARYAPQGTRETMAALLPRIETALAALKQLRPA